MSGRCTLLNVHRSSMTLVINMDIARGDMSYASPNKRTLLWYHAHTDQPQQIPIFFDIYIGHFVKKSSSKGRIRLTEQDDVIKPLLRGSGA